MATQLFPNSELIDTSRYECIDGQLLERPVPNIRHSDLQGNLAELLRPLARALNMQCGPELSVDRTEGRSDWMTPDFAVSMPGGYRANANGHALPPVFLVIEVLSPGQSLFNMRQKADRYLAWGAQTVWLIDPDSSTALVLSADQPGQLVSDGVLRAGELTVSLADVLR